MIKSIKELLHYEKDNELNILNGFKVLTMIFVLFGHRFMYLAGNPLIYADLGEDVSYFIKLLIWQYHHKYVLILQNQCHNNWEQRRRFNAIIFEVMSK